MGAPMSEHLAKAGYNLSLHDINPANAEKLATEYQNISVVDSPMAVAAVSDIVITMLPSGKYVQDVCLNGSGLIHGFKSGALLLDTSSSEPWLTIETAEVLSAKGVDLVDAPVSGAQIGARSAQLVFMAGGNKEPVARVMPLLNVMGKQVFHLGPVGAGHAMKCINNLITAITFMATAEGLTLGKRFGLDPEVMNDVLNVSTGMSWITQNHIRQRITSRTFDDPFKLDLLVKDIGIALQLAENCDHPMALSNFARDLWKQAAEYAGEGSSVSNMVRWVEQVSGTDITPGFE